MDARTHYGWVIKGLQGALNIVAMLVEDRAAAPEWAAAELDRAAARLRELADKARELVQQ